MCLNNGKKVKASVRPPMTPVTHAVAVKTAVRDVDSLGSTDDGHELSVQEARLYGLSSLSELQTEGHGRKIRALWPRKVQKRIAKMLFERCV